jgi:hypothetical protein
MLEEVSRFSEALASRYTIERQLGSGGMGPQMNADGSGSTRMAP